MGNKDSKHDHHHHHSDGGSGSSSDRDTRRSGRNEQTESAYKQWTDTHGGINKDSLERVFGPMLGGRLWRYLGSPTDGNVSPTVLEGKVVPLLQSHNSDVFLRMMAGDDGSFSTEDIAELIHVCRACAGVEFNAATDEKAISAIIAAVAPNNDKTDLDRVSNWIETTCPRLLSSLKRTVSDGFKTAKTHCDKWIGPESRLLSPMKVWLIQCCVPSYLIKPEAASPAEYLSDSSTVCAIWDLLYSSDADGLSPNRFETKVFNYRSPTVTIVETFKNELYCVCSDEEWKLSTQRYGKSGCALYMLNPRLELLESGGTNGMIFFNTKQRGLPQGLFVGSNPKQPHLSIEADFSNVRSIEVWGCGSQETYQAQQTQRQWEKRQVEKQQKVPLPGNWEDSPDRMLLEMGGVNTQHAEK